MARPRTFDEDQIRAALLSQFWANGYEGTALPDLEAATKLSRKSLYNAFGDKQTMFTNALQAFCQNAVGNNLRALHDRDAGLNDIAKTLAGLVDLSATAIGKRGCMICNTSREAIAQAPEIKAVIDTYFADVERAMCAAIKTGQSEGNIRSAPPEDLARFCLGAVVSISVLAKARQPQSTLKAIADQTIAALRTP